MGNRNPNFTYHRKTPIVAENSGYTVRIAAPRADVAPEGIGVIERKAAGADGRRFDGLSLSEASALLRELGDHPHWSAFKFEAVPEVLDWRDFQDGVQDVIEEERTSYEVIFNSGADVTAITLRVEKSVSRGGQFRAVVSWPAICAMRNDEARLFLEDLQNAVRYQGYADRAFYAAGKLW